MVPEIEDEGRKTLANRLRRLADRVEQGDPELIDFFLMIHEFVDLAQDTCATDVLACFDGDRHLILNLERWVEANTDHLFEALDAGGCVVSTDTREEAIAAGLVTPEGDA